MSVLSEDLLRLLDHPSIFADAVLKCDGAEIPVHKCILAVRSPVFAAMFQSEMQEGQSGIVNVVDIELSVLRVMLKYLYSGKIDGLTDAIEEELLFAAADKYGLQDLKRICVEKLASVLSLDNAIRILILGHLHGTRLKERAMEFICKCKFSDLEGKAEWGLLQEEYPMLAMEVMRDVLNKYVQESSHQKESSTYSIKVIYPYENRLIPLEVSAVDTVADVKQKIQVKVAVPPYQQSLYFRDRLLQDSSTISECGLSNYSVLLLRLCMEIFLEYSDGRMYPAQVDGEASILTLKKIIHSKSGIPVDDQRLFFFNRQLEGEWSLHSYGIKPQSTIHVVHRLRG